MGEGRAVSKEQPNRNDCPKGPDSNHVFKRINTSEGEFKCVYCETVQHFDIFDREWRQ